ncbi:uncharacterized protein LOC143000960 isoform X5 [Genypterus blacodes]|uniref:uncharacterized protein LOC143000960 isoform X5 n=1 Tax=Genypterus blacodes TaxID=154954 RepID=UPI003F7671AD
MMENVIVVILVIIPGVWSGDWKVNLDDQCALKGTSVVMNCTYDYYSSSSVASIEWLKWVHDSGNWRTRYSHWIRKSAYLSITELTAVVKPASVTEGEEVHLSCEWNCSSSHPSVVWFRDEQPIWKSVFQATAKDAGWYSCAAQGSEASRSAPVALNVQYSPKEVTLSLSPSAIIKGSSVDFTCSSDANPVVTQSGYSVYKDGQLTSTGQNHTIANIQPAHSGQYYCQAQNGISVSKSPEVNLDVKYLPVNVSVSMDPVNEGGSVNLTCSSDANPEAHTFTWYWRAAAPESSSVLLEASGQVLSLSPVQESQPGLYLCQAGNTLGGNNSTELLLEMKMSLTELNNLYLPVMAGVGVTLLLAPLVALLWCWNKKQADKQQTVIKSRLSRRGSSSSAIEMQNNALYDNPRVFSPSLPPPETAQEIPHYTAKPHHTGPQVQNNALYDNPRVFSPSLPPPETAQEIPHYTAKPHHTGPQGEEEAIIYSSVMIKPRNKASPKHHTSNSQALQDNRPNSGDTDVIYSNVAQFS